MTGESGDARVFFRDIKPYDAPDSLSELRGPRSGVVVLPPWIYWGPNPIIDLGSKGDVIKAYQATTQEGRTDDQVQILNRDLLIEIWPELRMPSRVRGLWEGRFPELTSVVSSQTSFDNEEDS